MDKITGSGSITEEPDTVSGRLRLRSNFAVNHLVVAAKFAREAEQIERQNAGAPMGPWFDGMMQWVPVAIVMAAAALEASVHEVIQDILDGSTSITPSESLKLLLTDLLKERSGDTQSKARQLALLLGKVPNLGAAHWQDAKLLARFRNEFMHFKPAWDDDDIHRKGLVEGLKGKVGIVKEYERDFQFPYGLMTYSCAKWSMETVLNFSDLLCKELGVADRFAQQTLNFDLP